MDWREATESEKAYLKKKYLRQTLGMCALCAVAAALAIYLLLRIVRILSGEADRSYLVFAFILLFVNLAFIGFMIFGPAAGEAKRYRLVKTGRIRVADHVFATTGEDLRLYVERKSRITMNRGKVDPPVSDPEKRMRTEGQEGILIDFLSERNMSREWIDLHSIPRE